MSKIFFGITWAQWDYCIYFPFVLIMIGILCWVFIRRKKTVALLIANKKKSLFIHNYVPAKQLAKLIISSLGFIFFFIALLRPRWGTTDTVVRQEGRDILVCFDISRSMLAQDCKPNRLALAKEKIQKLLQKLPCERLALILFAESALIQCPLTNDHAAFLMFLDSIDEHTVSRGSTLISAPIAKAIELYKQMPSKKTKLLLICTDGEDFSPDLSHLRQQAKEAGLIIITLGVGTEQGAPIPLMDNEGNIIGHQKDESDGIVISRLNQQVLRSLSQEVGGMYVSVDHEQDNDLKEIAAYVNTFEKEQREDKQFSEMEERYPWFVAVSFWCFLIEWLL